MNHFKYMVVVFGVAACCGMLSYADETGRKIVQVETTDGQDVPVYLSELQSKYRSELLTNRTKTNAQEVFINDDESVTIVRPVFTSAGKKLSIKDDEDEGACVFFGYKEYVDSSREMFAGEEEFVVLNVDGTLVFTTKAQRFNDEREKIFSLTCRN